MTPIEIIKASLPALERYVRHCRTSEAGENPVAFSSDWKGETEKAEALLQAAKDAIAAEEWVKCEERLPEEGQQVFMVRHGAVQCASWNGDPNPHFLTSRNRYWHPSEKVTHWKPRFTPDPPTPETEFPKEDIAHKKFMADRRGLEP